MIESKCPCCGGKVIKPDPPAVRTTKEERVAFEKWWDAKYKRRNPNVIRST